MQFAVATRHGETIPINCMAGAMEGMNSSLMLFNAYLDALLGWVEASPTPYVMYQMPKDSNAPKVSALCFADDMKLTNRTSMGMQVSLNKVALFGFHHNYNPNPKKTIALVMNVVQAKRKTPYFNHEYMCAEDRNADRSNVQIKTGDEDHPFQVLGVFQTLKDRSQMHM